jgi:hypothetical protein
MKVLSNETIVTQQLAAATTENLEYLYWYIDRLESVAAQRVKLTNAEVVDMFELHNHYYMGQQTGYHCDACRKTVYRELVKLKPYLKQELYGRTQNCIYRND